MLDKVGGRFKTELFRRYGRSPMHKVLCDVLDMFTATGCTPNGLRT